MDAKDLLALAFERFAAFQTLCNLYIVVALGLLTFIVSVPRATERVLVRVVVTAVFVGFALSNLAALIEVRDQREELAAAAEAKLPAGGDLGGLNSKQLLRPTPWSLLVATHLLVDAIAVAVIWLLPRFLTAPPSGGGGTPGGRNQPL